jgi:DNA-binding NtrC family response regulator
VRELENAVEQAVVLGKGEWIGVGDLPDHLRTTGRVPDQGGFLDLSFRQAREAFERLYFATLLGRANGVVTEAARLAGMPRQYFYEKLKRLGISRE